MNILVVDDNQDGARTMATALTLMDHEVRTAFNGAAAVREARATPPHVILLDLGMAGIDGYDVCQEIRRFLGDAVRIIAVTGLEGEEAQKKAREAGFDHFLTKPVDWKELDKLLKGVSGPLSSIPG